MIAFIKRHKWWFIGGGLALLVYWLYKRAQANAAAAQDSTAAFPAYPTVIYASGGGGGAVSSVGGVTGSTAAPAAHAAVTTPSPATPDAILNPAGSVPAPSGGVTGATPEHSAAAMAIPGPGIPTSGPQMLAVPLGAGPGGAFPQSGTYQDLYGASFSYDPTKYSGGYNVGGTGSPLAPGAISGVPTTFTAQPAAPKPEVSIYTTPGNPYYQGVSPTPINSGGLPAPISLAGSLPAGAA